MKTLRFFNHRCRPMAILILAGVLAVPTVSDARQWWERPSSSSGWDDAPRGRYYQSRYDHVRRAYYGYPRTGFSLSFGNGYAGRGYYFGPPGAAFYYERPGVRYYRTRAAVPGYQPGPTMALSTGAAVQRALSQQGYYRGPIDGDIGPASRRAIARFETDQGMPVRGHISRPLLDALGLR